MKKKISSILSIVAFSFVALAFSACSDGADDVNVQPQQVTAPAVIDGNALPKETCFFQGMPSSDVQYTTLKKFKAKKGVYGSVSSVIPIATSRIKQLGGNAAINFHASQAFSIWPWRFISPVAKGRAIFIFNTNGKSCVEMGGKTAEAFD